MIKQVESATIFIIIVLSALTFSSCFQSNQAEVAVPAAEVEVVNGTGIHRLARAVERELLNRKFNVYGAADAGRHYQRTVVVDLRHSDGKMASEVARALAIRKKFLFFHWGKPVAPLVEVRVDSSRFVDVEIIIGDDYQRFFPQVIPLY